MIKIVRTATPAVLDTVPDPSRRVYAKSEVRQSLASMQHGKCCYCERKIHFPDITPEDENQSASSNVEKHVEHFRPKGRDEFKHLTNDWNNLLLACNTCNVNKGQKFELDQSGNPLCIDPSDPNTDPENHIELNEIDPKEGPSVKLGKLLPRNNSAKGGWTIANVRLNEGTGRRGRSKKLIEVSKDILDYIGEASMGELDSVSLQVLRKKCSAKEEFSFVVREVCRQNNVPV